MTLSTNPQHSTLHCRHESSSKSLWDEDEIEMSLRNHLLVLCGTPSKAEQESSSLSLPLSALLLALRKVTHAKFLISLDQLFVDHYRVVQLHFTPQIEVFYAV